MRKYDIGAGRRAGLTAVLGCLLLLAAGCATQRGAHLYASGSEALVRGENARAIEQLESAAVLVPQASEIQNHLGLAYARVGRHDDALRAFEHAIALDCSNQAAKQNLAAARSRAADASGRAGVRSETLEQEASSDGP